MRALSPLWRDPGSDAARPAVDAGTPGPRAGQTGPASRDARGRRPQRAGLRAIGPPGQVLRPAGPEPAPRPCITAYTISLGSPEAMAAATAKAAHRPLLKIKLGGDGDGARMAAVRKAAPESELIVDANEAWTADNLEQNLVECAEVGVTLVEQPLAAGQDEALARIKRAVAVCADESVHDLKSLDGLRG